MGKVLYRKHRPKSLKEVVGQEHITTTLENALRAGRIGHAYLFTGPHGTGKTSVARIMAHAINDLPYTDESAHLDIVEIDAASNRRIDEIRDLRERVHIAPTSAKYKVYIIDEVHMLTKEAFNALLKTLEEPPAHVVFILATTEAHKLPATIISRTQRFSFKPAEIALIQAHLKKLASIEKLSVDDEALALMAAHGDGSIRDSISLLDQAAGTAGKNVTHADVEQLLGIAPVTVIENILEELNGGSPASLVGTLESSIERGVSALQLTRQIGSAVRQQLIKGKFPPDRAASLLQALLSVPSSSNPALALELALISHLAPVSDVPKQATVPKPKKVASQPAPVEPDSKITSSQPAISKPALEENGGDIWQMVLDDIRQGHNTLYGLLRMAVPDLSQIQNGVVRLGFAFPFHEKRLQDSKHREVVSKALADATGEALTIECYVDKSLQGQEVTVIATPEVTNSLKKQGPLTSVMAVFGNAEVMEN